MKNKHVALAFLATVFLFIIHLFIINSYSLNWDFHHVFFAGLYHTQHPVTRDIWYGYPYQEPDPMRMVETPFGPLQSSIPVLSYTTFFEKLKLLPFDSAFNLPAVAFGVMGVFILFLFLFQTFNPTVAWLGFLFLAAYPRYWGDLHTNVKDIPTAALYTFSMWLAWRAVNTRKWPDIIFAGLLTGITFNFKVNAIFIPIIIATWSLWLLVTPAKKYLSKPFKKLSDNFITPVGSYFLIASLSAYIIWSYFWKDPYDHLAYLVRFFQFNTTNMEVLVGAKWYCSGVNVPWYYPFWYLGVVTPVPILILAIIGFGILLHKTILKWHPPSALILFWFFIPLIRFIIPQASVIDGIRHFEEVIFPLMVAAALGANYVLSILQWVAGEKGFPVSARSPHKQDENLGKEKTTNIHNLFDKMKLLRMRTSTGKKRLTGPTVILILFIYLMYNIISYHPYQLSYFNELTGGIRGALGKYDIDYWGISQKQAVLWLNTHAPKGSIVHIVMSADVAARYLRPDLKEKLNSTGYDDADYVVVLNRQSFFYRYGYSWEYFLRRKPVYEVKIQGVPLTTIYDNHLGKFPRLPNWWLGEDPCMHKYW